MLAKVTPQTSFISIFEMIPEGFVCTIEISLFTIFCWSNNLIGNSTTADFNLALLVLAPLDEDLSGHGQCWPNWVKLPRQTRGEEKDQSGVEIPAVKYCMVLYYYISWYSDKPVCSSTHSDFKGGDFGNCPVALTHLAARNFPGNIVAIDLDWHCKDIKEAMKAVEGRLLVNLPGVELQKVKVHGIYFSPEHYHTPELHFLNSDLLG